MWTKEANEGFERLKKEVVIQPIMVFPTFDKPFIMEFDASNIVVGAVISQEGKAETFFSEKLNEAKSRYSSYDLKLYYLV